MKINKNLKLFILVCIIFTCFYNIASSQENHDTLSRKAVIELDDQSPIKFIVAGKGHYIFYTPVDTLWIMDINILEDATIYSQELGRYIYTGPGYDCESLIYWIHQYPYDDIYNGGSIETDFNYHILEEYYDEMIKEKIYE
jgi:hypothetical protein